jgi:stage II sporulation protein E
MGVLSHGARPEDLLKVGLVLATVAMLRPLRSSKVLVPALAVSGLVLAGRGGLGLVVSGVNGYVFALIAAEAVIAFMLTVVYSYGLPVVAGRDYHLHRASPEELSCALALLVSTVAGVGGITVGPLAVRHMTAALATMGMAYVGGAGLGAAAGATAGVMTGVGLGVLPATAGVFAFGGLLGGIFKLLGKAGVAIGFFLGSVGLHLQMAAPDQLAIVAAESVVAGLLFLAVPARVFAVVARKLGLAPVRDQLAEAQNRLKGMVTDRLTEVSQVFKELSRAFNQSAATDQLATEPDRQRIFGNIACRVCEACSSYKLCWEQDFQRTYRSMYDLLTLAELNNGLLEKHIPGEVRARCVHLPELISTINYLLDLARLNLSCQRRVHESREVVSSQLRGVSRALDKLVMEIVGEEERVLDPPQRILEYEVGMAKLAKQGSIISGDSALVEELKDGRLLVVLSDGMGAGPRAAMESKATVSLLERLLSTGFDRETAVRTVNSVLLLRSTEEMFATVDMALVDLATGRTEFIKIGGMPTFIRRDDSLSVLKSESLPIGILSQVHVDCAERFLVPGDLIVMVTDGLFAALRPGVNRDNWVCGFLARFRSENPKEIAEKLLQRCLGSRAEPEDDVTVVVVRMLAARTGAAPPVSRPAS